MDILTDEQTDGRKTNNECTLYLLRRIAAPSGLMEGGKTISQALSNQQVDRRRIAERYTTDGDIFEDEEGQITGHKSAAHIS